MLFISIFMLDIYNIKLMNMNKTRTMLLIMLGGTITFIAGLWAYSTMESLSAFEYTIAGLVLIAVLFGFIVGLRRMKDEKKGFAVDDELSHRIKQKAAASSFQFSFYLWTLILLFTIDSNLSIEIPIGIGIGCMGILFIGFWIYYTKSGLQDENTN